MPTTGYKCHCITAPKARPTCGNKSKQKQHRSNKCDRKTETIMKPKPRNVLNFKQRLNMCNKSKTVNFSKNSLSSIPLKLICKHACFYKCTDTTLLGQRSSVPVALDLFSFTAWTRSAALHNTIVRKVSKNRTKYPLTGIQISA